MLHFSSGEKEELGGEGYLAKTSSGRNSDASVSDGGGGRGGGRDVGGGGRTERQIHSLIKMRGRI